MPNPISCFGLYFDESSEECKNCSLSEFCRGVFLGTISWNVVYLYLMNYEPVDEVERREKDELILHISNMISERFGKFKKTSYKEEKDVEIATDAEDPYKSIVEAAKQFNVDLSLLSDKDIEFLKKAVKRAHPFPITNFKLGGVKKQEDPRDPRKILGITVHVAFDNIILTFSPAKSKYYVGVVVKRIKGMKAVYKGMREKEALEAIVKAKNVVHELKAKAITGEQE